MLCKASPYFPPLPLPLSFVFVFSFDCGIIGYVPGLLGAVGDTRGRFQVEVGMVSMIPFEKKETRQQQDFRNSRPEPD